MCHPCGMPTRSRECCRRRGGVVLQDVNTENPLGRIEPSPDEGKATPSLVPRTPTSTVIAQQVEIKRKTGTDISDTLEA